MMNKLNISEIEDERLLKYSHNLYRCPLYWLPGTALGFLFCLMTKNIKRDGIPVSLHYYKFQICLMWKSERKRELWSKAVFGWSSTWQKTVHLGPIFGVKLNNSSMMYSATDLRLEPDFGYWTGSTHFPRRTKDANPGGHEGHCCCPEPELGPLCPLHQDCLNLGKRKAKAQGEEDQEVPKGLLAT